MEFDHLLNSGPEAAQIALMNTMLQLEMALNDGSLTGDCTPSPPVSPVENSACSYSFSPPPQYMSTSTCTGAAAAGYQDVYYSAATGAYGGGAAGGVQLQEYVVSSSSPGAVVDGPGGGALLQGSPSSSQSDAMREMIFHIAALQPVNIDPEAVRPPKRRNVRTSKDPQSVAARLRRERISERIRVLQRLVPGGTKMDTASMLDEAIHYVKFLKSQVQSLELAAAVSGAAHRAASFGVAYPGALQHAPW